MLLRRDDLAVINRILEPHRNGVPAVVLHCGIHSYRSKGYPKHAVVRLHRPAEHGARSAAADRRVFIDRDGPNHQGAGRLITINEELYNNSAGKLLDTARPLARGKQGKSDVVVAWTNNYMGKTKVFATTLGHNNETVADAPLS